MTENRSSKAKYFWITLLVLLVVIPFCLLILIGMSQHSGREFSPDDFSRRSFHYAQVPFLDWVIIKKSYSDVTTILEQDLVADKLIRPVINQKKKWHLINDAGSTGGLVSHECDARFLTEYLDLTDDEGDNYWTQWNEKFPKSAKVFWPKVAGLARDEMYLKIPDVMRIAMDVESDDPDELGFAMDQLMAEIYLELGTLDLDLDRLERARSRLERAIEIESSAEAKQRLEDCLGRLGVQAESETEIEKAETSSSTDNDQSDEESE